MVCNYNLAVNIAESLSVFYLEMTGFADVQISKENAEGVRNIGAGNNSKVFFMKCKKSDKWKNKNCPYGHANRKFAV